MAYTALYNKYRPHTFEEVAGQQAIVRTLRNAIANNKIAHAYLFCGPRGTGKTSSGRLVDSFIQVEFTDSGTRCVGYYEYLQSKNYMNYLGLSGKVDDWNKNAEGAALIVNTVGFAPGQAI